MTLTLFVESPVTPRPPPLRLEPRDAVIGRGPGADWLLADPLVSARHCEIGYRNGVHLIRDVSTNGTTVNGQPLTGIHRLAAGDLLGIGSYAVRVGEDAPLDAGDGTVSDALATGLATLMATRARQLAELGVTRPDRLAGNPFAGVEPQAAATRLRTLDGAAAVAAVAQAVDAIERHHAACLDAMAATLRAALADLSPEAIAAAAPDLPARGDARDGALWRALRGRLAGTADGQDGFVPRFAQAFRASYERLTVDGPLG